MSPLRTPLALLLTASWLAAQGFTSPKGFETTEGNGSHGHVLASTNGLRWQQVDTTLRGTAQPNVASIAFRRDATLATSTTFAARTLGNVSIVLAHGRLATLGQAFGANYVGSPTTVFAPKNVNTPDWTTKPATAPAPFDFKLIFDQKWSYNGSDDFLWEVAVGTSAPSTTAIANFPFDFQSQTGAFVTTAQGTQIGTGCISKGQTTQRFVLGTTAYDYGTSFAIRTSANYGPAGAPMVVLLDVSDPNLSVTGLCGVLHALPTVVLPMGTASSNGGVASSRVEQIPFLSAAIGQSVYLQAIAADDSKTGIQLSVSQGERLTIPSLPSLPTVGRVHGYSVFGANVVEGPFAGGVIALFGF